MLPSRGEFSSVNCPFYDSGLCERPYCHYRHVKRGAQEGSAPVTGVVPSYRPTPLAELRRRHIPVACTSINIYSTVERKRRRPSEEDAPPPLPTTPSYNFYIGDETPPAPAPKPYRPFYYGSNMTDDEDRVRENESALFGEKYVTQVEKTDTHNPIKPFSAGVYCDAEDQEAEKRLDYFNFPISTSKQGGGINTCNDIGSKAIDKYIGIGSNHRTLSPPTFNCLTLSPPTPKHRTLSPPTRKHCTLSPPTPKHRTLSPPTPKHCTLSPPTPKHRTLSPPTPKHRTLSPPTPKYCTLSPPTPKHRTLSPPTRKHCTLSPPTPKHRTLSPPTPKHRTLSPPTPKHYTLSPPTPKHCTLSPPTPKHRTLSPPTPKHRTLSPPTPKHRTLSPPTPKHCTLSPPTPKHCTLSPPTPKHRTLSPPTPKHTTLSPPTPKHSTLSPPTPRHRTLSPPTPKHTTLSPPTPKHSTLSPPTPKHCTLSPPTPKHRTLSPPTPKHPTLSPSTPQHRTLSPPTTIDVRKDALKPPGKHSSGSKPGGHSSRSKTRSKSGKRASKRDKHKSGHKSSSQAGVGEELRGATATTEPRVHPLPELNVLEPVRGKLRVAHRQVQEGTVPGSLQALKRRRLLGSPRAPKVRIAHVPNVTRMLEEKTKVRTLAERRAIRAEAMRRHDDHVTRARTAPKGGRRAAHVPVVAVGATIVPELGAKVPLHARRRKLEVLVQELSVGHDDADALRLARSRESEVYARATSLMTYASLMTSAVLKIRQQIADGADMLGRGDDPPHREDKERTRLREVYAALRKFVLSESQLVDNGFPREDPDRPGSAVAKLRYGRNEPVVPYRRQCARCGKPYAVDDQGAVTSQETCLHHERRGVHEGRYRCCDGDQDSAGCLEAPAHVCSNFQMTNYGFRRTPPPRGVAGVFALDCEMGYTTLGFELTRVTVVDVECRVALDTLVRPDGRLVDPNTRYSGVTSSDLAGVRTTLADVQRSLDALIDADTILIGHSLDGDLRALKLIHDTVVDTSVLYPHHDAAKKRALRTLAARVLHRAIQQGEGGHDSAEDAIAAMQLALRKVDT